MEEQGLCALCKHFKLIASGREFERIVDTEYILFECTMLGVTGREDYLMTALEPVFPLEARGRRCPYWEPG